MSHKTLLEKLKPELKNELEKSYEGYPYVLKEILSTLNSLYFASDLPYGIFIELDRIARNKGLECTTAWDFFE